MNQTPDRTTFCGAPRRPGGADVPQGRVTVDPATRDPTDLVVEPACGTGIGHLPGSPRPSSRRVGVVQGQDPCVRPATAARAPDEDRGGPEAAAQELLVRLRRLEPDDPRRVRLREQAITEYMPFAGRVASRYFNRGQPAEDLRQVAYLGLLKAVDGFDPDYGAAFLAYATPLIRGELRRYFRDFSWVVHVPRRIQELCMEVGPATETLRQRLNRDPTPGELAVSLGVGSREVLDAIGAAGLHRVAALDPRAEPDDEPGPTLGDLLGADDPGYQHVVDRETLKPLLMELPPDAKLILLMTYFHGMPQRQIGRQIGVSQMQVSRLLNSILATLRRRASPEAAPRQSSTC
jgi:RNA polymerase sigma-B factor